MKTKTALTILSTILFIGIMNAQAPDAAKTNANRADPSAIPDSYDFSWKYTMEMETSSGKKMTANYLLNKNADYFGMNMMQAAGSGMLMIMDTKNKLTITAFEKEGKKMAMARNMKDHVEMDEKKQIDQKFTYKSLPDKTILGYKCKGVEASNPNLTMVFYFTNDAPVNFSDMFKSQQGQKTPDMIKDYFKPGDKPLVMSVDVSDKKSDKTTHTKCIALEKSAFVFNKADYKFR